MNLRNFIVFLPLVLFIAFALVVTFKLKDMQAGKVSSFATSKLIGKPAPEFSLPPIDGSGVALSTSDLKGKYTLINIFASWCVACIAEHPVILSLGNEHKIPVYGIDWNDKREDIKNWLKIHGNPYDKIGFDEKGKAIVKFGISGVPETFLVNKEGIIIYNYKGPLTAEIVENEIIKLIKSNEKN